ncbi:MAG: hypothetical protein LBO64_00610 [Desulfovibrio sp.]|jgi:hypothetical protein|nr:hypothetical protein [Desulfovibrio sp.]
MPGCKTGTYLFNCNSAGWIAMSRTASSSVRLQKITRTPPDLPVPGRLHRTLRMPLRRVGVKQQQNGHEVKLRARFVELAFLPYGSIHLSG